MAIKNAFHDAVKELHFWPQCPIDLGFSQSGFESDSISLYFTWKDQAIDIFYM